MATSVSVVVVSRGRPAALARCLIGLAQLDYANFEVIVVACPDGQAIVQAHPQAHLIKLVPFDTPNISLARNLGIEQAAGKLVAFIDDDAVPEPLWLRHLSAPFSEQTVAAAGGYVIGRNGISFQWKARKVDRSGNHHDLELPSDAPIVFDANPENATKTEGTNMAFRRDVLLDMGGFDPGFHFFLDETDLNMRLAKAGSRTAVVPLAQVHHGFAQSERRTAARVPTDLRQIGASERLFLRKHCPAETQERQWIAFCEEQRLRLFRLAKQRKLNAGAIQELLRGLQDGGAEGLVRSIAPLPALVSSGREFMPFQGRPDAPRSVLAGRVWQSARLHKEAADLSAAGHIVSLFIFSPTAWFHKTSFLPSGVWQQKGGRFGRSQRSQPVWRYRRFSTRLREELNRIHPVRG